MTQIFQNENVTQYRCENGLIIQVNNHRRNDPIIFKRTTHRDSPRGELDPAEQRVCATEQGHRALDNNNRQGGLNSTTPTASTTSSREATS
jgi:hypothetical protein